MYSLIATCKLSDVDPRAWLADALARIGDRLAKHLYELVPWKWRDTRLQQAAACAGDRRAVLGVKYNHPVKRLDELPPWNWREKRADDEIAT
jgi:IS66 C-terminal element